MNKRQSAILCLLALSLLAAGCSTTGRNPLNPRSVEQPVPYPVSLTLPQKIVIHSFTSFKTFEEGGKGIEAHIEPKDAFNDGTKAFGEFRFLLYKFLPQSPDPKGQQIASWTENLMDPSKNALHWTTTRTYKFRLRLDPQLKAGDQFVLVAWFSSPYTERLFAQSVITAD
ncbi:MAG: hypothetical protein ACE15C_19640 [Phycisphaerae bacterium]